MGEPVPPDTVFPAIPVLVLSGQLDSLTPAQQGAEAAALFPNAQQIIVANSFHVTAEGERTDCPSVIAVNFFRDLNPGDARRRQPRHARAAAAAVLTAGDAVARWYVNYSGHDVGLRGGSFNFTDSGNMTNFTLDNLEWVEDLAVGGTITWNILTPRPVMAQVTFTTPAGAGSLTISWYDLQPQAQASIQGSIGGRMIVAGMQAP